MTYCGNKAKYFDLTTKTWSAFMAITEAAKLECAMFEAMQTGAKVELLTTRCHTSKPATDRRYAGNRETVSAENTHSQAIN